MHRLFVSLNASRFRAGLTSCCLLMSAVGLAGCGGEEGPAIATVKGKVTFDGQPLTRGTVYFIPDASKGTKGPMAIGEIDDTGHYQITSSGERDGAIVGFHKIRVEARAEPKDRNDTQPPYIIPARYDDQETSRLTTEVKAGEENIVDLKLTTKPATP